MESAWNWYLRAQRLRRDRARGEAMMALRMEATTDKPSQTEPDRIL
jgi:hypothetical protein